MLGYEDESVGESDLTSTGDDERLAWLTWLRLLFWPGTV